MENNSELNVGRWSDERLAILSPDREWQPNMTTGLTRFRKLRDTGYWRKWTWGVAAAAATCLFLLALPAPRVFAERCLNYCSAALSQNSPTSDAVRGDVKLERSHMMADTSAILPGLDGTDVTLGQYRGKVVLVNFWATWCQPCRSEIPWLIEFDEKYGAEGLVILGVAMDDEGKKIVEPWIKNQHFQVNGHPDAISYRIIMGNNTIADEFGGLIGLPTSMLYSRDGKKIKTVFGLINHDDLLKAIESQL